MKRMIRMMFVAAACGMFLCGGTAAQEKDAQGPDPELQKVQDELKAIREELKAVRGELKQVLKEVKSIKAEQERKPTRKPKKRQADTKIYDINIGGSPILGPKDAPITIVEFSDIQCPFTMREYPKIQQIMKDYPNDVRLVIKHFPLSFHKKAKPAHAAMALALKQKGNDAFWQMHDMIIKKPKALDIKDLRGYAEELGMDLEEFDRVLADPKEMDTLLAADLAEARKTRVTGTPTVLINGLKLSPRNIPDYKARIEEILKKKREGKKKAEAQAAPAPKPAADVPVKQ